MDYMTINYTIPFLGFIITLIAQIYVNNSYNKYKYQGLKKKTTGAEVARTILDRNGLQNIKIEEQPFYAYGPFAFKRGKTDTIAAASVAAHECGHAIQHKENYTFLKIRSSLVPVVNFSTKFGYIAVMIGLLFSSYKIAIVGLVLLLAMLLFQVVTLPVEFNASSRAKKQLVDLNIIDNNELQDSKTMLNAAAFTYVASVLSTLLQILRLALIIFSRRDD